MKLSGIEPRSTACESVNYANAFDEMFIQELLDTVKLHIKRMEG